tara:strand:+ start:607 stop:1857 length:1251 start_codon:yes stop_codon:yes gene_type:complete
MKIQKYKLEFIFKYKNDVEIDKNYFDEIREIMSQSTDKKNFKVKISKNISLNNNKWHRKRFLTDEEKIKKKINSLLNMYSKNNYEKITIDILKLKINNTLNLEYLVNMIIFKYKNDYKNDVWNYLIEKIIFSNINKWKLDDTYIAQRILNKVQDDFNKIINFDYQETLETLINDNIEEYYKIKNKNIGLMKLICELFKYKLIDKNLITYILENLTLDLKKNFKLELGVSLVQNLYKYINNEEKQKFIEFFSIYLKNPNLNKKIKFMILDFIETREVKTKKIEKKIEIEINDDKIETVLRSGINDFIENNNLLDFTDNIKKYLLNDKIAGKFIYYLILYILENNNIDICLNLLNNLINKKFFNSNNIKLGINSFYEDYDDYKWDYKNIDEILEKITNYLLEKKILDNNFNILIKKKI